MYNNFDLWGVNVDIFEKIDCYFNRLDRWESFFNIYLFTNENINGYVPYFDLKDKSLLTVGSSCDQLINANMAGCRDITVCDVCPFTKFYFYLKLASFICLNREEFLSFLCATYFKNGRKYNHCFLNNKIFDRIKVVLKEIDYESYCVWNYLFSRYTRYDIGLLFKSDRVKLDCLIWCNKYLKTDYDYDNVKDGLLDCKINFINGNIVTEMYDRKFDNIWLSNVASYLDEKERLQMVENNSRYLSYGGKMLVCYFWNIDMTVKGFPLKEFMSIGADRIIVPGLAKGYFDNSILVYKKGRVC